MSHPAFARSAQPAPRRRKKGLEFFYLLAAAAALVAPMLLIASKRSSLVDVGYQITRLREENVKLREEQARLRGLLAESRAPAKILDSALKQGLEPVPATNRFLVQKVRDLQREDGSGSGTMVAGVNMEP